jgi:hypothetical protein
VFIVISGNPVENCSEKIKDTNRLNYYTFSNSELIPAIN